MKSSKTTSLPSTAKTVSSKLKNCPFVWDIQFMNVCKLYSSLWCILDIWNLHWNFPSWKVHVFIVQLCALIQPGTAWIDFRICLSFSIFLRSFPVVYLYICLFVFIYPSWTHGRQGRGIMWQETHYGAASNKETIFSLAYCDLFWLCHLCQR